MGTVTAPIAATTSLSILLHGAVVAALLTVYGQTDPNEAVGQGLEIELISSITASDQHETDISRKQLLDLSQQEVTQEKVSDVSSLKKHKKSNSAQVVTALYSENRVAIKESVDKEFSELKSEIARKRQNIFESDSVASAIQSTNASQQHHSILELLHSSISDNKEYPYLARRQRREGMATVAFVLHPDGTIENTRLINSSQTVALDRAALSAVKGIEPFIVAQDYLEQSKEFHVDVVFDLL
ncbi:MAG: energy transducer TonB [Gammaproteobacteria bacterium]|nr:energy transducer TonB [Gammaproteobacteria bacterium]